MIAPLLGVVDRRLYQRIIPHHLADIQKYPCNAYLKMFAVRRIYSQHKWAEVACIST